MDRETCDYSVFAEKEVVEEVFDPAIEISLRMQKRSIRPCTSVISPRLRFIQKNSVVLQRRMQKPDPSEDQRRREKSCL